MAFRLEGSLCVLTGAGSGIGRATALELAAAGCDLALVERNPDTLAEVAAAARRAGATVSAHVMDVADADAVAALPASVAAAHGRTPNVLVNNAGVALVGTFDVTGLDEFAWLHDINFWGVVRMTHAFLPSLRQAREAHVVNISSIFGIVAPAGQAPYAAAKFGVRGFSEAVRQEWRRSRITLTVVHPGGIKTAIARDARIPRDADRRLSETARRDFEKMFLTSPERAARKIRRAIESRRRRLLIGFDAVGLEILQRLFPVRHPDILDLLARLVMGGEVAAAQRMRPEGAAAETAPARAGVPERIAS